MKPEEFIRILAQAARLKITTRHCYTEEDRKESVADHSWRVTAIQRRTARRVSRITVGGSR